MHAFRLLCSLVATVSTAVAQVASGEWSLAVLPDTQYYTGQLYGGLPSMFTAQTTWIRDNRAAEGIAYTLQLGDITETNTDVEWARAQTSMAVLTSPYAFVFGNHDCALNGGGSNRTTLGEGYFPAASYATWSTFGGVKDAGVIANSYHTFEAWGHEWIIICLEWAPTDAAVTWANTIMDAHPRHVGILLTHVYMYYDNTRYDQTLGTQSWGPWAYGISGSVNDGQELWDNLVKGHRFAMTLNGHVLNDGTGYLASDNNDGDSVHQMLVNYQVQPSGGNGYLRMLKFGADGRTVTARSYSPTLNANIGTADHAFSFQLDLGVDDIDRDSIPDYYDADFDWDGDGLNNLQEHDTHRTSTLRADTDGDGISDFDEVENETNPLIRN